MKRTTPELEAERAELLTEIRGLRRDLAKMKAERDDLREQTLTVEEIVELKKKIVDLEIRRDKLTEDHEREKREVTHMVGLEKKRQSFEIDQAKRETKVTVREENLVADRARFEEQMAFTTDRFEAEVKYLKNLMGQVLERLPTITVDRTIEDVVPRARRTKTAAA